jgi:hypothetical protein
MRNLDTGDFQLLYFLNMFGVRYILNDEFQYGLYMNERLRKEKNALDETNSNQMKLYQ